MRPKKDIVFHVDIPNLDDIIRGCTEELAKFLNSSVAPKKLWDLLDNMCVVVDLKFEQKILQELPLLAGRW
jgi:hypothetical protein